MLSRTGTKKNLISGFIFALIISLLFAPAISEAADIKAVPSATRVSPGENFFIDIMAENIPSEGLGAVQFRLNIEASPSVVSGIPDASQVGSSEIALATPMITGAPTASRSGIGEFFLNAAGTNGILMIDNGSPGSSGSYSFLYTFAHTAGAILPSGSGSIARFHFAAGRDVAAENITITLSDVMLLKGEDAYPLDTVTGAVVQLGCMTTVPDLLGLSREDALLLLQNAGLLPGNIYEINNPGGYALNSVLAQSQPYGTSVLCETQIDLAINTPPAEVSGAVATDITGDENGTVALSWNPSVSGDTAGYRIYLVSGSQILLKEINNPVAAGTEISGLPNGQVSQLKITVYDGFGNESQGSIISAVAIDDVAPRIVIEGITEGAFYSSSVLPSISVTDAFLSVKEMLLNGIAYTMAAIGIEGNYALKVTATDLSGNTATKEIGFVIDKTPPSILVSGIEKGGYYNADLYPVILVTDSNLHGTTSTLNGSAFTSGTVVGQEGAYELSITAVDKAGNSSSDSYTFYIDKTKPVSSITTGEPKFVIPGEIFVTGSTPFALTGIDEGVIVSGIDRIEYRLNNSLWNTYQSFFTLAGLADGVSTIDYRSIDIAGNTEDYQTLPVKSDNTPPNTVMEIGIPAFTGTDGSVYITQSTDITLSASDLLSGVMKTEYKVGDGPWTLYAAPFRIAEEGGWTVYYRSVDNLGNIETEKSRSFVIDSAPPVSTILTGNPNYTDSSGNAYATEHTVFEITATDSGSGVLKTEYRINDGAWTPYAQFNIPSEGNNRVEYRSMDNAGNTEAIKTFDVVIDNTPPVTEITAGEPKFTSSDGKLYVSETTVFTLTFTDNLSGVSKTEYRIDSGEWQAYAPFTISLEGIHAIGYRSIDNLGNTEIEKTLAVFIDNTPPSSVITVGDPKHQVDDTFYISGKTEFSITATDSVSGLNRVEYKIDGGLITTYTVPFTLSAYSDGNHTITYRSVDNNGNTEADRNIAVVLDNTAPESVISASDPLIEGVVNIISPKTRFTITPAAGSSDYKEIKYSIDGGLWQTYFANFSLSGLIAGPHTISFKAYDNLGNEEAAKTLEVRMIVMEVAKEVLPRVVLAGAWWCPDPDDDDDDDGDEGNNNGNNGNNNGNNGNNNDDNGQNSFRNAVDRLSAILSSSSIPFYMPTSEEDFKISIRSGMYNTYMLINFMRDDDLGKELREAVNHGDGIIYIKAKPVKEAVVDEMFGVDFKGISRVKGLTVNLPESPISEAGTLTCGNIKKVRKSELISETAQVLGTYADKRQNIYPAVISNRYGNGKAVLFNFNLLEFPETDKVAELIVNSINYSAPDQRQTLALDSVPVRIDINNSTEPAEIKVTETLPYGTTADAIIPSGTLSGSTIKWELPLASNQNSMFGYRLNLPDLAGDYQAETSVTYSNRGNYRLYGNYSLNVTVSQSSTDLLSGIINDLESLTPPTNKDRRKIENAIDELNKIDQNKKAEKNIKYILNALEELSGTSADVSADVSAIRLKIDELLRIWQKKWVLAFEAN